VSLDEAAEADFERESGTKAFAGMCVKPCLHNVVDNVEEGHHPLAGQQTRAKESHRCGPAGLDSTDSAGIERGNEARTPARSMNPCAVHK
jgi:hypothetical protein